MELNQGDQAWLQWVAKGLHDPVFASDAHSAGPEGCHSQGRMNRKPPMWHGLGEVREDEGWGSGR